MLYLFYLIRYVYGKIKIPPTRAQKYMYTESWQVEAQTFSDSSLTQAGFLIFSRRRQGMLYT